MKKILFIIPLLIILASCKTQKHIIEVPVITETVRTEYIRDVRIDSVFVKDSIDRWIRGDTVFIYKEHTKYKYLKDTDTVVRVDTIPKIVELKTTKEVEVNRLKWYQEALMWLGGVMLLILFLYIIYKTRR